MKETLLSRTIINYCYRSYQRFCMQTRVNFALYWPFRLVCKEYLTADSTTITAIISTHIEFNRVYFWKRNMSTKTVGHNDYQILNIESNSEDICDVSYCN